jgi:hypothetical protein
MQDRTKQRKRKRDEVNSDADNQQDDNVLQASEDDEEDVSYRSRPRRAKNTPEKTSTAVPLSNDTDMVENNVHIGNNPVDSGSSNQQSESILFTTVSNSSQANSQAEIFTEDFFDEGFINFFQPESDPLPFVDQPKLRKTNGNSQLGISGEDPTPTSLLKTLPMGKDGRIVLPSSLSSSIPRVDDFYNTTLPTREVPLIRKKWEDLGLRQDVRRLDFHESRLLLHRVLNSSKSTSQFGFIKQYVNDFLGREDISLIKSVLADLKQPNDSNNARLKAKILLLEKRLRELESTTTLTHSSIQSNQTNGSSSADKARQEIDALIQKDVNAITPTSNSQPQLVMSTNSNGSLTTTTSTHNIQSSQANRLQHSQQEELMRHIQQRQELMRHIQQQEELMRHIQSRQANRSQHSQQQELMRQHNSADTFSSNSSKPKDRRITTQVGRSDSMDTFFTSNLPQPGHLQTGAMIRPSSEQQNDVSPTNQRRQGNSQLGTIDTNHSNYNNSSVLFNGSTAGNSDNIQAVDHQNQEQSSNTVTQTDFNFPYENFNDLFDNDLFDMLPKSPNGHF